MSVCRKALLIPARLFLDKRQAPEKRLVIVLASPV
jgi:hypothetical protein